MEESELDLSSAFDEQISHSLLDSSCKMDDLEPKTTPQTIDLSHDQVVGLVTTSGLLGKTMPIYVS